MTVRTKSRSQQWMAWLCAALVSVGIYIVLSYVLYDSIGPLLDPRQYRLAAPLLVFFVYVAKNTRWDGVVREVRSKSEEVRSARAERESLDSRVKPAVEVDHQPSTLEASPILSTPTPTISTSVSSVTDDDAEGEALYAQAREMKHRTIPDFNSDGEYLKLLGESAEAGYSPALAKLGEYAMRRAAWVEAYYWMKKAQRNGMHGLSPTLREIRMRWARDGFPRQSSNISMFFSAENGALGRALLRLDSGHAAAKAKEFLKANYPEYLP